MGAEVIGVFDSGVGGLSTVSAVRRLLPSAEIVYLADSAWFPYGARQPAALVERTARISRFLMEEGAVLIVVACNTASNAAIASLRERFSVPFVGVEPAVKVAVESGRFYRVGVLCTAVTATGERYQQLLKKVADGYEVVTVASRHLADLVERQDLARADSEALIAREVEPLMRAKVEVIVLGCTHYAFIAEPIARLTRLPVLEPSLAVARQVRRLLRGHGGEEPLDSESSRAELAPMRVFTTADTHSLDSFLTRHGFEPFSLNRIDL